MFAVDVFLKETYNWRRFPRFRLMRSGYNDIAKG